MFLSRMSLDRSQVEDILAIQHYFNFSSAIHGDASNFEKWYNVTCSWLKNNTDVWSSWPEEIIRTKVDKKKSNAIVQIIVGIVGGAIIIGVLLFIIYKLYTVKYKFWNFHSEN